MKNVKRFLTSLLLLKGHQMDKLKIPVIRDIFNVELLYQVVRV